jgi:hypothetical protein
MVRRNLSAFKAFFIVVASCLSCSGVTPVWANETSAPGANQSIQVTHIVNYNRREYRLSGGEYYICKGKYLSYDNYRCSPKSGVDKLTAERTLAQDIKEEFGASAVILNASVLETYSEPRRLEVKVGVPIDGKPDPTNQHVNIELLHQFPSGYWLLENGEYLVCADGEITTYSRQSVCTSPRTVSQLLIGRKIYTTPIQVIDHIQQKNGFAAEILNMHVDQNNSLRVTYRKAVKSYDAVKDKIEPEVVGNNRPKWLESVGLAGYADHVVVLFIVFSSGLFLYAAKKESLKVLGMGLGIQIAGALALSGTLYFAPLAIASYIYICHKDDVRNSESRVVLRSAPRRQPPMQPQQITPLATVEELRGSSAIAQTHEATISEAPTAAPGSRPVRKIILD